LSTNRHWFKFRSEHIRFRSTETFLKVIFSLNVTYRWSLHYRSLIGIHLQLRCLLRPDNQFYTGYLILCHPLQPFRNTREPTRQYFNTIRLDLPALQQAGQLGIQTEPQLPVYKETPENTEGLLVSLVWVWGFPWTGIHRKQRTTRRKDLEGLGLSLFAGNGVVNELGCLGEKLFRFSDDVRLTVDDVGCAERFQVLSVVKRSSRDDGGKARQLGELNG